MQNILNKHFPHKSVNPCNLCVCMLCTTEILELSLATVWPIYILNYMMCHMTPQHIVSMCARLPISPCEHKQISELINNSHVECKYELKLMCGNFC